MNRDHERGQVFESPLHGHHDELARDRAFTAGDRVVRMDHYSDGTEKRPSKSSGFRPVRFNPRFFESVTSVSAWRRRGLVAISALELAHAPDGTKETIPQWHISFSRPDGGASVSARRPNTKECQQALACFGMAGAEEDNHEPGIARHFWMPVDPARRRACECKVTEKTIVEPDGHRWTTPVDDKLCYGCNYAAVMARINVDAPCPVHHVSTPTSVIVGGAVVQEPTAVEVAGFREKQQRRHRDTESGLLLARPLGDEPADP